jgi:hypothetical protein
VVVAENIPILRLNSAGEGKLDEGTGPGILVRVRRATQLLILAISPVRPYRERMGY